MHIGHFTNTYIPTISGVVRQISALRKAHLEMGHHVSIFTQNAYRYKERETNIYRYPTSIITMPMDFPVILPYSRGIDRRLPALDMDVIHVHHPFVLGKVGLSKAKKLNLPAVFTFHTQYWEHSHFFPVNTPLMQQLVKWVIEFRLRCFLQHCHSIVVYTKTMRDLLIRKFGIERQIQIIPTGIDLEIYQQENDIGLRDHLGWSNLQIMISVGRMSLEKNWLTLIEAACAVARSNQKFRLVLIGDGPQRRILERCVDEMGISEQVYFMGRMNFEEVPRYLKAADLFGFASVTETIGRVTMEAMASGLPVVAVNAPGTCDLVSHGREGFLTANNAQSLAVAIHRLLDDVELRRKFGEAAARRAKTFDVKREAQSMLDVYYNAIERYRQLS